jgi:peptide/nickel transport system ATP-binding protein
MSDVIFSARDVEIQFKLRGKVLTAIRGASLDLYSGETLALVGESGCGKSVFTKSFIGMLDKNETVTCGQLLYRDTDLAKFKTENEWLRVRGKKIAMVFQDSMTALNPVRVIGEQINEVICWHFGKTHEEAKEETIAILRRVGIPDAEFRYHQYPHEFSGGMRQRVVIAIAIACHPEILICDEPTTALDVTIQAQILKLIKDLQKELKMSVIFITHDLGVVANVADRVAVMYAGQIIEYGTSHEIFKEAIHPYTKALLLSLPQLGIKGEDLYSIKGAPPNLYKELKGDAFAPRNPDAMVIDYEADPPFYRVSDTHYAKTWLLHEMAGSFREQLARRERHAPVATAQQVASPAYCAHDGQVLLAVRDLTVNFKLNGRKFCAVDHISFDVYKGETLALVGESGSGKTTIARAIIKIYQAASGSIQYNGETISKKLDKKHIKQLRLSMQMIFQDPMASLNDRAKVDYIISEGLYNYGLFKSEADRINKIESIMREVGLNKDFASRFPHEFSGGQRQRIGIARSLVMNPDFIIADEPISALDVSIRAQVLNLLNKLKKEHDLTYLFIAHDLSVVKFISDRIAVIYKGKIVELAECDELFLRPLHPYTRALLSAVPFPDPDVERNRELLVYDSAIHNYTEDKPHWTEVRSGHFVWCNEQELGAYHAQLAG